MTPVGHITSALLCWWYLVHISSAWRLSEMHLEMLLYQVVSESTPKGKTCRACFSALSVVIFAVKTGRRSVIHWVVLLPFWVIVLRTYTLLWQNHYVCLWESSLFIVRCWDRASMPAHEKCHSSAVQALFGIAHTCHSASPASVAVLTHMAVVCSILHILEWHQASQPVKHREQAQGMWMISN